MQLFRRPFRSIDELHAEQLECYRRSWHRALGVAAALHYCAKHDLTLPRWVLSAAPIVLGCALSKSLSNKRGRSGSPLARYRQDMVDYARWDAVCEVRSRQISLREELDELRACKAAPRPLTEEHEKLLRWVGHTWLRAYECAAMILAQTIARGGPDAMKGSYIRVKGNQHPLRYHLFDRDFLRSLGLEIDCDRQRHRKIIPLHQLTL